MTHPIVAADAAQEFLDLPAPRTEGGIPLMQALRRRRSIREFDARPLGPDLLSDLLWAAYGINDAESGRRTAPSARNWQEIDLYAALADGLYVLEPAAWRLRLVSGEDIRHATGLQDYVAQAPLDLVFVANLSRVDERAKPARQFFTALDTGYISQNVYLFCASQGLATVARGLLDRPAMATTMRLRPDQRVMLAQSVGFPAV
ncbi:nitroreductase (plasmid) [Cupriavidus sp. USMAHM13]|uniref:nitroreductase family protein n=1 Tax=Cupriavidus sp. USMAHM13 TaxID=1389192 RepID=UPI0008A6979E|nr:SagB/ThcOx family dehydrogenase [Cupriavidus sp. USMAHM13]AOZ04359.1 nitroreductase [Cupriavidus sp. USMAHM13]